MKSQTVRVIDVLFIMPDLIFVSLKKDITTVDRGILLLLGIATGYYNYRNFKKQGGDQDSNNI